MNEKKRVRVSARAHRAAVQAATLLEGVPVYGSQGATVEKIVEAGILAEVARLAGAHNDGAPLLTRKKPRRGRPRNLDRRTERGRLGREG